MGSTGQDGRNDGAESALRVLIMASALQNLKSTLNMLLTGVGEFDFLARSMFRDLVFQVQDVL